MIALFLTTCMIPKKIGSLNKEQSAALAKSILSIWEVYFLPADTNYDGSVEFLELLVHMKAVSHICF